MRMGPFGVLVVMFAGLALGAETAAAQAGMQPAGETSAAYRQSAVAGARSGIPAAWSAVNPAVAPAAPSSKGGRKGGAIGALVGAGAGMAVAYWAASNYGENAPGEVCTRCFWQWSAIAIPVGAIAGYAVGSAIAPQRGPRPHETYVTPVVGRRGGGMMVSVRY